MKNIFLAILLLAAQRLAAQNVSWGELNIPAAAIQTNHDAFVGDLKSLSAQVDYSKVRPSTAVVNDGAFSSTTLTVADFFHFHGSQSSATITLVSGHNVALSNESINIKGRSFVGFFDAVYATNTARNLAVTIDNHDEYTASASSNVITVLARSTGSAANAWTITSSSPTALSLSGPTFGNGRDPGYLFIQGTQLTDGVDFTAQTSSHVTANAIAVAINANSSLSSIIRVSSSANTGILTLIAQESGVNAYNLSVSSVGYLTPSAFVFAAGSATAFSVSNDQVFKTNHGFSNGLRVLFEKSAGTDPTGLTAGTTYFALLVDADHFKVALASSSSGVGTAVDITALTGSGQFSFLPLAFSAGSAGFEWKGSNDGITYYPLLSTAISSVTYAADGGGLWSFPDYSYRFLRLAFTSPAAGGINLNMTVNGRR